MVEAPMSVDVSVVIAAYNVETYLERAVASALDQKGVRVEVIIVDDCSTDATPAVIASLTDARITSMRLPVNSGPGAARNAAFQAARGNWIAVLDADDFFVPDRLERIVKTSRELRADIVVDNLIVSREGESFPMFPPKKIARLGTLHLADFIAGNAFFLGGYTLGYLKPVFSASFLRKSGIAYTPGLRIGEDYILMAEALAKGAKCIAANFAGYCYTVRKNSVSHRLSLADVTRIMDADAKFLAGRTLNGASRKAQALRTRRLQHSYAFTVMINALKCRDFKAALNAAVAHPASVRYLWRPVAARIEAFLKTRVPASGRSKNDL